MTAAARPGSALLDSVLKPETVVRTTLANGMRVLVRRDAAAPVVAIVTYVKAGYFDETDDIVGIAHVLEHMYFKGTPQRGVGEIARETKASGGYLNAGTIYDHTSYYTVLPASGFASGIAIQADAYTNSLIDAAELARELEVIIEEAKRKQDNPGALATETMFELLHDKHRIRRWRIGREDGLRHLTRDNVWRFYKNFYRPSNTVLSIVGDVDPDEALALVRKHYGSIPDARVERTPGPLEPDTGKSQFRYREFGGDIQQAELVLGWRTPHLTHDDSPALDLLAAVLSGGRAARLYRAVRERRLASSISAYNYTPTDLGVFVIHATARPEQAREAAAAAWDQLRRVRAGEITVAEVDRARRVLEASWLRRFETMEGQANHLASWESLADWHHGTDYVERLLATDAARIADVARRWLTPERAAFVAYRPETAPPFAAGAAEMLAALEAASPAPLDAMARPAQPTPVPGSRAWVLEGEESGVRIFRTSGGVPMLMQARPGAIAQLGWFVRGGATDEPPLDLGLTTMMTRTSLKGTERRTAQRIAEDSEFLGGVLSAAANADGFQWTMSVPARRVHDAVELLADVVQRPSFTDEAVDSERAVVLADLASLRDDMYRWPVRLAAEAAWGAHPYGRSVLGTESSLAAMTASKLRQWHENVALETPGVLVCVGDVDPDEIASLFARFFGRLRATTVAEISAPQWPRKFIQRADPRDKAQSALAMLFEGPSRSDDDRFAAAMIAGVTSGLGGRFFDTLRDKQSLAYTVMASAMARRHAGAFSAYIATSPEKEDVARAGLLSEFEKLRHAAVTDAELSQAKTYALGTWAIRRESAGAVMGDIADAWLFGSSLAELSQFEARVRAVTAADMLRVAKKYFDPDRRVEGVVRGTGRSV